MATVVCVVGDKGGTGKSTWARAVADVYRLHGIRAGLFDGDWLARSLFKVYRSVDASGETLPPNRQDPRVGCVPYDITERRLGRDVLINSLSVTDADILLHDLPAGFRSAIASLMGIPDPTEAVRELASTIVAMGHRVAFCNVMTPSPSDFHTAPWLAASLFDMAPSVAVVAVRNGLFDHETYSLWEREAARSFKNKGGIEILMPRLDPTAAIVCDQRALRFSRALLDERLSLAERLRIISWLRRFGESLEPIASILGLPDDIATRQAIKLKYQSAQPAPKVTKSTVPPLSAPEEVDKPKARRRVTKKKSPEGDAPPAVGATSVSPEPMVTAPGGAMKPVQPTVGDVANPDPSPTASPRVGGPLSGQTVSGQTVSGQTPVKPPPGPNPQKKEPALKEEEDDDTRFLLAMDAPIM